MVQIIGEDSALKKRITCHKCASILEYTKDELQQKKVSDYSGDSYAIKYLICPKCSNKVHDRG